MESFFYKGNKPKLRRQREKCESLQNILTVEAFYALGRSATLRWSMPSLWSPRACWHFLRSTYTTEEDAGQVLAFWKLPHGREGLRHMGGPGLRLYSYVCGIHPEEAEQQSWGNLILPFFDTFVSNFEEALWSPISSSLQQEGQGGDVLTTTEGWCYGNWMMTVVWIFGSCQDGPQELLNW